MGAHPCKAFRHAITGVSEAVSSGDWARLDWPPFELVMTEVIAQTEETNARRSPGLESCSAPGEPAGGTVRCGKPALPDVRGGLLSIPNDKVIVAIREGISSADGWEANTANGMPARYY